MKKLSLTESLSNLSAITTTPIASDSYNDYQPQFAATQTDSNYPTATSQSLVEPPTQPSIPVTKKKLFFFSFYE